MYRWTHGSQQLKKGNKDRPANDKMNDVVFYSIIINNDFGPASKHHYFLRPRAKKTVYLSFIAPCISLETPDVLSNHTDHDYLPLDIRSIVGEKSIFGASINIQMNCILQF